MSMDPNAPFQSPGMPGAAPQKSGGSKVLLGLGIGCGIMLLLCCGGVGAFFFLAKDMIKVEDTPAAVAAVGQEITELTPPSGFEPAVSMKITVPIINKGGTTVMYEHAAHEGLIQLTQVPADIPAEEQQAIRVQIEQTLRQQGRGVQQLALSGDRREIKTEVRGKPAVFTVQEAKSGSGETFYQVQGEFEGKNGLASITAQFPAEQIDEEQTEAFVRSIK